MKIGLAQIGPSESRPVCRGYFLRRRVRGLRHRVRSRRRKGIVRIRQDAAIYGGIGKCIEWRVASATRECERCKTDEKRAAKSKPHFIHRLQETCRAFL